jgi:sugar O-acyltransferase (sialic acid O-acetyltransferase NeuD family)
MLSAPNETMAILAGDKVMTALRIAIVGAGTYGQVFESYIRSQEPWEIAGFIDDDPEVAIPLSHKYPYLGSIEDAIVGAQHIDGVIIPIGENSVRTSLLRQFRQAGFSTPSFIHSAAHIGPDVKIEGTLYALPFATVMPWAILGDGVILSMNCSVAHHTALGTGVFVSTGANVGASIEIGSGSVIGIGATVMTGVTSVGLDSVVGAGAVVIRDVLPGSTVVGVPAKTLA